MYMSVKVVTIRPVSGRMGFEDLTGPGIKRRMLRAHYLSEDGTTVALEAEQAISVPSDPQQGREWAHSLGLTKAEVINMLVCAARLGVYLVLTLLVQRRENDLRLSREWQSRYSVAQLQPVGSQMKVTDALQRQVASEALRRVTGYLNCLEKRRS